jgi:hypothetical protein
LPFIITISGRRIDPWQLTSADIVPLDIATGLANVCRWGGQLATPFTVAEHSVYVARLLDRTFGNPHLSLQGLLHDAAEAYIGDLPTPFKHAAELTGFRSMEDVMLSAILSAHDLHPQLDPRVKTADRIITLIEARDICPRYVTLLRGLPEFADVLSAADADPTEIVALENAQHARSEFLAYYTSLISRIRTEPAFAI